MQNFRTESDLLGIMEIPADTMWGIHTARALANFNISGRVVHPELVKAYGAVKLACFQTNRKLGYFAEATKAEALEQACSEMAEGLLTDFIVVDSLQGGAGTSTNLNVNEVIANRALEIAGKEKGDYSFISPLDDVNLHQSTNDTFPTALKVATIRLIRRLEQQVLTLQEAFQTKEKEFAHVVKIGRTQLQDGVLTTLGREMGAYAEAFNRDRWRLSKCEERMRVVNLGGTAIGTGLGAPRQYILRVADQLRENTGIGLARAENLIDNTQNADVFVEVSGMLKACAVSVFKISADLRLMASGPDAGLAEIILPQKQTGSTIMPGKINPVIPEAASQAAILVMGHDVVIAQAAAAGNLELNQYLPLIAHSLLESIDLLTNACHVLQVHCIQGMKANEGKCRENVLNSTALITALIPVIGYEKSSEIVQKANDEQIPIRDAILNSGVINEQELDELISPEVVCRLGFR
ncbi:MAG TPA: aspartate ammonia-lyase [Prolixibacteraceae bacterium]|nr:aspartate ammonia-lyase [Prolixibacteraceae bacterium]